jgi:Flp pilus assembly protein TadD
MSTERQELVAALRAGRRRDAARRARALARAGEWDLGVAATIVRCAPDDAPERADAEARLDVALIAGELIDRPEDPDRLARLLDRLVAAGRADEALHGLRLATRAARASVDTWLGLVVALYAAGAVAEACDAADEAVELHPNDAQVWSVAAHLRLAAGRIVDAVDACRRALELAPGSPGPRLTAAILCALRGDRAGARSLFDDAARCGAPPAVVAGLARVAGV